MNSVKANSHLWPFLLFSLLAAAALFTIQINDHLFPWDERFHALVARNLSENPSFPMLYAEMPLKNFDSSDWYRSEAWLHKPPLFSYQMAFWIALFGDAVWVMRLNSAVMLLLFAWALYSIARLRRTDKLWAASMAGAFSFSPLLFSLISGRMGMDHNDINFLGHLALSFYALEAYRKKPSVKKAIAIGAFSAAAVLSKWLPGLLVYLSFGLLASVDSLFYKKEARLWKGFVIALSTTLLLSSSWHIYAYLQQPEAWLKALQYNGKHFNEALENHGQAWYFHLKVWGTYLFIPLLLGGLALFSRINRKELVYLVSFLFVLLFFSLAKTKLPAYTLIGLVPLFILSLNLLRSEKKFLPNLSAFLAVVAVGLSALQVTNLYKRSLEDPEQKVAQFYRELAPRLAENALLFNLPSLQYPQVMYYTGKTAFDILPAPEDLRRLEAQGKTIYIMQSKEKPLKGKGYSDFNKIDYRP